MSNIIDLEKIRSEMPHFKLHFSDIDEARKFLIRTFNKIGLEFINVARDYSSYTMVVIKFKKVVLHNPENSIFKQEIIEQLKNRECSRDPFKIRIPLYFEVEYQPAFNFVLWYKNERFAAEPFDLLLIIAIAYIVYDIE